MHFDGTPDDTFRQLLERYDRDRLESILGGSLSDGPHTVHIRAEDASGGLLDSFDLVFTLDTVVYYDRPSESPKRVPIRKPLERVCGLAVALYVLPNHAP